MIRKPILLLALVATALLAGAALSAAQAPTSISLKVKGAHVTRQARFCHKHKRLRVFRARATLEYRGFVTPAPAKHFPVTVQVEACVHGRFVRVANYNFQGKRGTGKYKGFFRAPRPRGRVTYFSARTVVGGTKSGKAYFGVRR